MTMLRVGVVGTGIMGADHARILDRQTHGATVAAVADVDRSRAQAVASGLAAAQVRDPDQLVASDDVDAVVVASADATHEQFVLACLAAGKPVLCEKPLAPTSAASARLVEAELQGGEPLVSVGFMRRFDPGYEELKAAVDGGLVGDPLLVHCVHRNAAPTDVITPPAQIVTSSVVHEIDVARWLLGEELATVTVRPIRTAGAVPGRAPVLVTLETASGAVVDVEAYVHAGYGYDVRCEVVGTEGTAALDPRPPTVTWRAGQQASSVPADWRPRFADAYRRELQDWVTAVVTKTRPAAATAWDGYLAALTCDAGVASAADGTVRAVEVPERPAFYAPRG